MLPQSLTVNGREYAIDPTFQNCVTIMLAFEDVDLMDEVKLVVMLQRLFLEDVPLTETFVVAAREFLDGGEDGTVASSGRQQTGKPRLFSFGQDMKYIRTAIQRTHGVNLREASDLHWWKFLDMFMDLEEDCMFNRILQLRQQKIRGKLTKEEKKLWSEMADVLVLKTPEMIRAEAEAQAFEAELERLEALSGK